MELWRPVVSAWEHKIELAWRAKKKAFQDQADEALRFYSTDYDWLYEGRHAKGFGGDDIPPPSFRMTVNKVAEVVQLFGPALYSRNPTLPL